MAPACGGSPPPSVDEARLSLVAVACIDTGVGLTPQAADAIFQTFFTTKPHGTGMGLRISRSIVEAHGGRLWADSEAGRGATFHFTLPTAADGCG